MTERTKSRRREFAATDGMSDGNAKQSAQQRLNIHRQTCSLTAISTSKCLNICSGYLAVSSNMLQGHWDIFFTRYSKRPHMPAQSSDDVHAAVDEGI